MPKWSPYKRTNLAKYQPRDSYSFWAMLIWIFSPFANFPEQSLSTNIKRRVRVLTYLVGWIFQGGKIWKIILQHTLLLLRYFRVSRFLLNAHVHLFFLKKKKNQYSILCQELSQIDTGGYKSESSSEKNSEKSTHRFITAMS